MAGDPSKAIAEGADLQTAFQVAISALQTGEHKDAAAQFGQAYVAAEICLNNAELVEEIANLKQFMWQCAIYRAACLTTFEEERHLTKALESLKCAVQLAEQLDDHEKLCESLGLIASLQNRMEQFESSLEMTALLIEEAKLQKFPENEQVGMVHRGTALSGLKRHAEALEILNQARSKAQETGNKRSEGDACLALSKAYAESGDKANARKIADAAMGLAEAEGDSDRVNLVSQMLQAELNFAC